MVRSYITLLALLWSSMAAAQMVGTRIEYTAGTGFFVSPYGHIITNNHVVHECKDGTIELRGAIEGKAQVLATDTTYDLALLQADLNSPSVGTLLATERTITPGEKVLVMGYPLSHSETGTYALATAKVVGVKGPTGEPQWLQFTDSAQQGNSGGPLLDPSGNIIGVVTGKSELYSIDAATNQKVSLGRSDIAITLPVLKHFLTQNGVHYLQAESLATRTDSMIETNAQRFILNIRCITGTQPIIRP